MFNKVLISFFFCSIIISCENETRPVSRLNTLPIEIAKNKSASAIGSTPEGKIIVFNTGTGKPVLPCKRDKGSYVNGKTGCLANIVEPSQHITDLLKSTENVYKIEVLKNGQKVPAQLSLIATVTFQNSIPAPKEKAPLKKHKLSLLDTIISTATAETVTEYCTTIFSGGSERQTCISEGNNCELYRDAYGEAAVLAVAPECKQYF